MSEHHANALAELSSSLETQQLATLEEIKDAVRAELPRWWAPQALELRDQLPRTPLGKVRRAEV